MLPAHDPFGHVILDANGEWCNICGLNVKQVKWGVWEHE